MRFIDELRERRDREWWAKFHREHRWDRLAQYNAERSRGILHAQWWIDEMADEQRKFDEEMGHKSRFPIRLDPA